MIDIRCTDLGKEIKMLRRMRGMERAELAEAVGISDSHLKKIESGTRQPGISTYQGIMQALGAGMVVLYEGWTKKEDCIVKVQEILMDSTEEQAMFMVSIMEVMAKNIGMLVK